MPIVNGRYQSPTWTDGSNPAIDSAELLALCQSAAGNFSINGGTAPPTASTPGAVCQTYICTENGQISIYLCTDTSNSTYTWKRLYFGGEPMPNASNIVRSNVAPGNTSVIWVDTGNGGIFKIYDPTQGRWAASPGVFG